MDLTALLVMLTVCNLGIMLMMVSQDHTLMEIAKSLKKLADK